MCVCKWDANERFWSCRLHWGVGRSKSLAFILVTSHLFPAWKRLWLTSLLITREPFEEDDGSGKFGFIKATNHRTAPFTSLESISYMKIYENDIAILYPSLTQVHVPFRLLRRPFGLIDDDEILDEEGEPKTGEQRRWKSLNHLNHYLRQTWNW